MNQGLHPEQLRLLGMEILDHGRMIAQLYSLRIVGVEVEEIAFRFRESKASVIAALTLLESGGRASRTTLSGYWTLYLGTQNQDEVIHRYEDQPSGQ
jgi:hypothetical protein